MARPKERLDPDFIEYFMSFIWHGEVGNTARNQVNEGIATGFIAKSARNFLIMKGWERLPRANRKMIKIITREGTLHIVRLSNQYAELFLYAPGLRPADLLYIDEMIGLNETELRLTGTLPAGWTVQRFDSRNYLA